MRTDSEDMDKSWIDLCTCTYDRHYEGGNGPDEIMR